MGIIFLAFSMSRGVERGNLELKIKTTIFIPLFTNTAWFMLSCSHHSLPHVPQQSPNSLSGYTCSLLQSTIYIPTLTNLQWPIPCREKTKLLNLAFKAFHYILAPYTFLSLILFYILSFQSTDLRAAEICPAACSQVFQTQQGQKGTHFFPYKPTSLMSWSPLFC